MKMKTKSQIKIDGFGDKIFEFKNVESSVVLINEAYYLTCSDKIIKLGGSNFYLKTSPLLVKTYSGRFILKENSIRLNDGQFSSKTDPNLIKTYDNKLAIIGRTAFKILSGIGGYFSVTDPKSIFIKETNRFHYKDDCVTLSQFYKDKRYFPKLKAHLCEFSNEYFLTNDLFNIVDYSTGRNFNISKIYASKADLDVALESCRVIGGRPNDYLLDYKVRIYINLDRKKWKFSEYFNCYIPRGTPESNISKRYKAELDQLFKLKTKNLLGNVSERYGKFNNIPFLSLQSPPKSLFLRSGDISGGNVYYKTHKLFRRSRFSQSLRKTGGIGYSFGLEHETCAGDIPSFAIESTGLSKVGDGSTRFGHISRMVHYEYVSSVMHGDIGVDNIYRYSNLLKEHTIANEKCSTHIHIGGNSLGMKQLKTDIPVFNREFSAYAIKLGSKVENSLAKILPEFRDPRSNGQCRSIRDFSKFKIDTTEEQNKLVALFVFGANKLSRDHNSKTKVRKWSNEYRKWWLNLVNCNSNNQQSHEKAFSTIEFRIFPPSVVAEHNHFYLLIALAFTWFVENKKGLINNEKTIEIKDVLHEAYKNKPIYEFVKNMYNYHLENRDRIKEDTRKTQKI